MDTRYDVIIIGAGAVGCAVARELSRYDLQIAVLEKNSDVAGETTGRNSAVVHAGFNNRTGSLMASLCVEGNENFGALCEELDVPFRETGKLVVAFDAEDVQTLASLLSQGRANGCRDLELLQGASLEGKLREHGMEYLFGAPDEIDAPQASQKEEPAEETSQEEGCSVPGASPRGRRPVAALWSPHTGITNPFLYCVALAENAQANGTVFYLDTKVTGIQKLESGFEIRCVHSTDELTDTFRCRYLINCAGLQADRIAAMAGVNTYRIWPCRGEYFILDKTDGANIPQSKAQGSGAGVAGSGMKESSADSLYLPMPVYPAPPKHKGGLGVHLTPTIEGNIIIGPSAEYLENPATEDPNDDVRSDYACTRPVMDDLLQQARQLLGIERGGARELQLQPIGNYSGIRPKLAPPEEGGYHDFVIRAEEDVPGLINLVGIESPGLTASVPIAKRVCRMIGEMDGSMRPNPDFIGTRRGILRFREQSPERQAELIAADPDYGEIICRCQKITKREIRDAIENPLHARSISAIKYRAWATTGRCNGGYCLPRIVQILTEEYGMEPEQIRYRDYGSEMFTGHVK